MSGKKKSRLDALRASKGPEKERSTPISLDEIKKSIHIAVYLMVKNEEKRICVSLDSVKDIISSVVIYDTGSTDNTIQIIRDWCDRHNLPLRLKEGTFVDFSTSRNVGLEFIDTFDDIDYVFMLDSNDELKTPLEVMNTCAQFKGDNNHTGFLVCQEWYFGESTTKYYNVRLIKPRCNWRYKGVIHEYINRYTDNTMNSEIMNPSDIVKCPSIVIYQDRIADEGKSLPRYNRDKELLLAEIAKNPKDSRSMFYLAQTCECLNQPDDALYYYRLRTMLDGFEEERFQAYIRCGDNAAKLGHSSDERIKWYLKAFAHSKRAEPLVKIGNIYASEGNHHMASFFYKEACALPFPSNAILFVDRKTYDYERFHKLGISAWYAGKYMEGKVACINAIKAGMNSKLDQSNLSFYENKEKDLVKTQTKASFIITKLTEKITLEPGIEWKDARRWAEDEYDRLSK